MFPWLARVGGCCAAEGRFRAAGFGCSSACLPVCLAVRSAACLVVRVLAGLPALLRFIRLPVVLFGCGLVRLAECLSA